MSRTSRLFLLMSAAILMSCFGLDSAIAEDGVVTRTGDGAVHATLQDEPVKPARDQREDPSIEAYLKDINTLTIDTAIPASSDDQKIGSPQRITPQVTLSDYTMRQDWAPATLRWQIPDICHRALYYEHRSLERCGVHAGWKQPTYSNLHFVGSFLTSPFQVRRKHPCSLYYFQNHRYSGSKLFHD